MADRPLFAEPDIERLDRSDGTVLLRSRALLHEVIDSAASTVGEWLGQWADLTPNVAFLAERPSGDPTRPWTAATYGETLAAARSLAAGMLDAGLGPDRPLLVLSGSSIAHGTLLMGCHLAGIPIVPVSVAYSLIARDLAEVRHIVELCRPGMVFVDRSSPYAHVLDAIASWVGTGAPLILSGDGERGMPYDALCEVEPGSDFERAASAVGPDTVAKILFTSGSTGMPKGVVTTHRMLCANQHAMAAVWPFLAQSRPVLCDWLPWSHTFGSSHNLNLVLRNGGTLYLDQGKPAPGLFDLTVANLADAKPTISVNVPAGYARLADRLDADPQFCAAFFERLELIFYAAAALPQDVWDRLEAASLRTLGRVVPMTSSWGLTETAPAATAAHLPLARAGVIGVPLPGVTLKLVPNGAKLEVRVRGDSVMPGYLGDAERTAAAFDDEGYFITGDAVRFVDDADPNAGLRFDGRVAEDFKLQTGTRVSVGTLRPAILTATAPLLSDCVVTGHDREFIGLLVWPAPGQAPDHAFRAALRERLAVANRANGGSSSTSVRRVVVLDSPPSIDLGETTDKGYINQRAVLDARGDAVSALYAEPPGPEVLVID
jgi:feruloyl-CoA synthase